MRTSPLLADTRHGFFTRKGGVSEGFLASLNFGKDDTFEAISQNRSILLESLQAQDKMLLTLHQVHSNRVITITEDFWTFENRENAPQADALVTARSDIVLGVLSADCAPVLLSDTKARVIGAVHSGWRGTQRGILEETLKAMEVLGAERSNICAAVGPAIQQASYEVGPEVRAQFLKAYSFSGIYFKAREGSDRFLFDVPGLVEALLRAGGVESVDRSQEDTYTNPEEFFSCRRAAHKKEPTYGCQLSAIM